jgi:hypothetical protein
MALAGSQQTGVGWVPRWLVGARLPPAPREHAAGRQRDAHTPKVRQNLASAFLGSRLVLTRRRPLCYTFAETIESGGEFGA